MPKAGDKSRFHCDCISHMKPFLLLLLLASQPVFALTEAEIQSHLDAAIKAGGGEVVIPPGVHVIEKGLLLKDAKKLRFIGLDAEACVFKAAQDTTTLLRLEGACEGVRIEKLTFEGGQDGISESKAAADGLKQIHIGRCFFQNQQRTAVRLEHASGAEIEDSTFRDMKADAVRFGERVTSSFVAHCNFTRCGTGVVLSGTKKCLAASNELSDCDIGILITGPADKQAVEQGNGIALNAIDRSATNGIQFNAHTRNNAVQQNEITGSGQHGIHLAGEGQMLKGNQISGSKVKNVFTEEGKHALGE